MNHIPYTYRITFLETGQHYYGVRYAKNCHPSDLWSTYFTSSAIIESLIQKYGLENFIYEIRKEFPNNPKKARLWESKVLSKIDAANNTNYLNQHNGDNKFYCKSGYKHTEKTKLKISNAHKGKKLSEETKQKLSLAGVGKKHTAETKQKLFLANIGKKLSKETKKCISAALTGKYGRTHSETTKQKMSNAAKGKPKTISAKNKMSKAKLSQPYKTCPHCNLSTRNYGALNRWHNDNCKHK